jgi:UDP-glucose 4-epimerase
MSLLNVLKTLESKINAQLGLGWDEVMPSASTNQSSSADSRMEREREAHRAQQIQEKLKKMEEEKRKLEEEQRLIEEENRKKEIERAAKMCGDVELKPGHYYQFNTGAVTCVMYFICALRSGDLVFSSSTYAQIRRYSVEGTYSSNNPDTLIVHKSVISKNIRTVNDRTPVDVAGLSDWIRQSRL